MLAGCDLSNGRKQRKRGRNLIITVDSRNFLCEVALADDINTGVRNDNASVLVAEAQLLENCDLLLSGNICAEVLVYPVGVKL